MGYGYADKCPCRWCKLARSLGVVSKPPPPVYDGPEGYDIDVLP